MLILFFNMFITFKILTWRNALSSKNTRNKYTEAEKPIMLSISKLNYLLSKFELIPKNQNFCEGSYAMSSLFNKAIVYVVKSKKYQT